MKKKGDALTYGIVIAVLFLVIFVIFLKLDAAILTFLKAGVEDFSCTFSVVMASFVKVGGITATDVHLKCPPHLKTVTMHEAGAGFTGDEKKLLAKWGFSPLEGKPAIAEYRINEVVATEMKSCWKRLGRGSADPLKSDTFRAKTSCIVCARIKFDADVQEIIKDKTIDSLTFWTMHSPTSESSFKKSYYEYLKEGNAMLESDLFEPQWKYKVSEPVAVVYIQIPSPTTVIWGEWVAGKVVNLWDWTAITINLKDEKDKYDMDAWKNKPFTTFALMPYSQLNNHCEVLANT